MSLAMLAGFVDAVGFLKLGGLFVSFMSGNSTRMAVGIASTSATALYAAMLIGAFVVGVVTGSLLSTAAAVHRKSAVLAAVSVLLLGAAALDRLGHDKVAVYVMALAMGCANTVFQREGEVTVGVTYMTGTLVKLGQGIAGALTGRSRTAWIPYLLLWLGLVSGSIAGAIGYREIGMNCLWLAALVASALAVLARKISS